MLKTKNENKKNMEKFSDVLSATENFNNACKQVWIRNGQGAFKEIFWYNQLEDDFSEKISKMKFHQSSDYYITKNSFYAGRRSLKSLFSCDCIVIDIDNHMPTTSYAIKSEIIRLLFFMGADYSNKIPAPNMFVPTGRGVQLWYKIESCLLYTSPSPRD